MSDAGHFRSSPRPQICVQVLVHRKWATSPRPLEAYTRDISAEGAFVVTGTPMEPGDRVRLVLTAPTAWEPLTLDAEVAWQRPPAKGEPGGVGVRFVGLGETERRALGTLVAQLEFES